MNIDIINKPKENISEDIKVTGTSDIVKLKDVQAIRNAIREHLLFIGLDRANNVRHISVLGIGTTCNVIIDTKEIIRTALMFASDKVVLVHNHPSNSVEPSKDDMHITNVTKQILKPFNIELLDHIIITEREYISMTKANKINQEYENKAIKNMTKGFLIEENQKLRKQIEELQQEMQTKLKVISAKCIGGYNDNLVYNVEINYNGIQENVTLEKCYYDMKNPSEEWKIFSELRLTDNEKNNIIQVVSKNPPSIFSDLPAKVYEDNSIEEIEM